ncbi:FAD-binding oxidoreductase [soil metagenome]
MADHEQRHKPWMDALRDLLGDVVVSAPRDLESHGKDEGYQREYAPDCVVYARDKRDVLDTLEVAREHHVPVTPFGAGSSLEGAVLPVEAGISLDLSRMDGILSIEPENLCVTAGPGVTLEDLNDELRPHGLFFSIDLGANASLGGMAGTNASGSNALRYGDMREQVLEMEVVLSDGRTIRVGSKARKNSSGYDLKDLLIGSEGTLGIVAELTVKARPLPIHYESIRATFEDIGVAVEAAVELGRSGLLSLARVELVDETMIQAVNAYQSANHAERPTLWMAFHGSEAAVAEDVKASEEMCREAGALGVTVARTEEEQQELWEARNHAWYAARDWYPEDHTVSTDICVPVGHLPEAIAHTRRLMDDYSFSAPILGHMGDGNYHVFFHVPLDDEDGWRRLDEVFEGMAAKALELGGTCTGEHGVGLRKMEYQEAEHGEALSLMRKVKEMFDPLGLLNPGKVIPAQKQERAK